MNVFFWIVQAVLATIAHARRKEPGAIAFNAVLLVLAARVARGRFGPTASDRLRPTPTF